MRAVPAVTNARNWSLAPMQYSTGYYNVTAYARYNYTSVVYNDLLGGSGNTPLWSFGSWWIVFLAPETQYNRDSQTKKKKKTRKECVEKKHQRTGPATSSIFYYAYDILDTKRNENWRETIRQNCIGRPNSCCSSWCIYSDRTLDLFTHHKYIFSLFTSPTGKLSGRDKSVWKFF